MHQTRQETSKLLPIPRKGTKYVARALHNPEFAVPLVIAVRDMLKLAKTAKEVREMIKQKALKVDGRIVYELNDAIELFQILEAGKTYQLDMLPTGKFTFLETKVNTRLCKIMNKRLISKGKIQFNLNDGSNILSKDNLAVGDSVYLDFEGKVKKHVALDKGKEVLIFSGRYSGNRGKILEFKDKIVSLKINGKDIKINQNQVIVL